MDDSAESTRATGAVLTQTAEAVEEVSLGAVRIAVVEGEQLRVQYPLTDRLAVPDLLRRLTDGHPSPDIRIAELLSHGITGLIQQAVTDCIHRDESPARPSGAGLARRAMLQRIKQFARDRLADPELCPELLAREHHISLRYLQKLFQGRGESPASWIRDERLPRCHRELQDPRLAHLTIAVIGERSGFYGASHFSRLFRERFGITPRELRRAAAPETAA